MRTLLAFLFLLLACDLPAQDDRDRTTAAEAKWFHGITTAGLGTLINAGWRFTDLEIENVSPGSNVFSVAAVKNTGAYAKTWYCWTGVTAAQLQANLSQTNSRLIDIEAYSFGGSSSYVAIAVSNTGADQKTWWWFTDLAQGQVGATAVSLGARLVTVKPHIVAGQLRYIAVMVANAGADFHVWSYQQLLSTAAVSAHMAQTGQRIYWMSLAGVGFYDVIFVDNPNGFGNWWLADVQPDDIDDFVAQNLARVVHTEVYIVTGGQRYVVLLLDNANELEKKARQRFYGAPAGALGKFGFLLKEVGGATLARMRDTTAFEPADTMATLYHVHAMRRISQGLFPVGPTLNTQIDNPVACGVPGTNRTIEYTLRQMMENSNEMATLAISNWFGLANIDNAAASLGMVNTNVAHTIGCLPVPLSTMTLADLALLYEQVAGGWLDNFSSQRAKFYELMDERLDTFPTWGSTNLDAKIDAEAMAIGMPMTVRDNFKSQLHVASKHGGVGFTAAGSWLYYYSGGGWMSVPFRGPFGLVIDHEFAFGVFDHGFTAQSVAGRTAMADAELELVWDRVKAAMNSWGDYTPGSVSSLPGSGCPGSAGTPLHTTFGAPDLYGTVSYRLSNAPANAPAIALFGFSSTQWNGAPLPADLAPLGAAGCVLRTEPSVSFGGLASATGTVNVPIAIGTSPGLIGTVWYSQFLVFDPAANQFGATLSNAKRTTVGGWH